MTPDDLAAFAAQVRTAGWRLATILIALAVAACGSDGSGASTDVAFVTVHQGLLGHFNRPRDRDALKVPTLFRFDDQEAFGAFWRKLLSSPVDGEPSPPVIDFDAETVVAVLDAPKKDYGDTIAIRRIDRGAGHLRVTVAYHVIDPNGCYKGQLETQPSHIVALAKTNLDIEMALETELISCDLVP